MITRKVFGAIFVKQTQSLANFYYSIIFLVKYRLYLVTPEHRGGVKEILVKHYLDTWI